MAVAATTAQATPVPIFRDFDSIAMALPYLGKPTAAATSFRRSSKIEWPVRSRHFGRSQFYHRLKVFEHLREWFEEFNLYHRKEGLIVKQNDDLLSATRYAMMMRRCAEVQFKPAPVIAQQVMQRAGYGSAGRGSRCRSG